MDTRLSVRRLGRREGGGYTHRGEGVVPEDDLPVAAAAEKALGVGAEEEGEHRVPVGPDAPSPGPEGDSLDDRVTATAERKGTGPEACSIFFGNLEEIHP